MATSCRKLKSDWVECEVNFANPHVQFVSSFVQIEFVAGFVQIEFVAGFVQAELIITQTEIEF